MLYTLNIVQVCFKNVACSINSWIVRKNWHSFFKFQASGSMYFKLFLAGGQGFEPQYTGPKPVVLPLDDPPILTNKTLRLYHLTTHKLSKIYNSLTPHILFSHTISAGLQQTCGQSSGFSHDLS